LAAAFFGATAFFAAGFFVVVFATTLVAGFFAVAFLAVAVAVLLPVVVFFATDVLLLEVAMLISFHEKIQQYLVPFRMQCLLTLRQAAWKPIPRVAILYTI